MPISFCVTVWMPEGNVQGDGCGACNDNNAARWSPAIVNVKYDSQTVPSGVSTAEWTAALNTGLDVWSNVSGSILDLDNARAFEFATVGSK